MHDLTAAVMPARPATAKQEQQPVASMDLLANSHAFVVPDVSKVLLANMPFQESSETSNTSCGSDEGVHRLVQDGQSRSGAPDHGPHH